MSRLSSPSLQRMLVVATALTAASLTRPVHAALKSWDDGTGTWSTTTLTWAPIASAPVAGDVVIFGDRLVAQDAIVTLGEAPPDLGLLTVTGGVDLRTGGHAMSVVGDTEISALGSLLLVDDRFEGDDITLSNQARLRLENGDVDLLITGGEAILTNNATAIVEGWGSLYFGDVAFGAKSVYINEGLTKTSRPLFDVGLTRYTLDITIRDTSSNEHFIDLDGVSEAGTFSIAEMTTLSLSGHLSDSFNSTGTFSPGGVLGITEPWSLGNGGVLDVNAFSLGAISFVSTIEGGEMTSRSGSIINVNSGTLKIASDYTTSSSGVIQVDANSTIHFAGTANITAADAINLASSDTRLIVSGTTSIQDVSGTLDWDGLANIAPASTEVHENGHLDIDVSRFGLLNPFQHRGAITLDGGRLDVRVDNSDTTRWTYQAAMTMNNVNGTIPVLGGNPVEFNIQGSAAASLVVAGAGKSQIESDVTFRSGVDIKVAEESELELVNQAIYDGMEVLGEGIFNAGSVNEVIDNTRLGDVSAPPALRLAMDGDWTIAASKTLTLHATSIDVYDGAFDGTITLEDTARLLVNLPGSDGWSIATGGIKYSGAAGGTSTFLAGAPLDIQTDAVLVVQGSGAISAPVEIAGTVEIQDPGESMKLRNAPGAIPNRISGGTIRGDGKLDLATASSHLVGFGRIQVDVQGAAGTRLQADDGQLEVLGDIVSLGTLGTADADGVLTLTQPLNTAVLSSALELQGGTVIASGGITNSGTTRGFGVLQTTSLNNTGRLVSRGGQLVITTQLAPDLDGDAAGNDGRGSIEATQGDIQVEGAVGAVFNGSLSIGNGHQFLMQQPGSRFRNAPASEDSDGSGDFGRLFLNNGVLVTDVFEQASQLEVSGTGASHIAATQLLFADGSETILADATTRLSLEGNVRIHDGAKFTGAGTLGVTPGSKLNIETSSVVDAILFNDGELSLGAPFGAFDVLAYEQHSNGKLLIDINGTTPGTEHDLLQVTTGGTATLAGQLTVTLPDGYSPSAGDTFEIIHSIGGVSGTFASATLDAFPTGHFDIAYSVDGVSLVVADGISGDYNADGFLDCTDVDALVDQLAAGGADLHYDLNVDGQLDLSDVDQWLVNAGRINLPNKSSYLFGDANLDGLVDVADFNIWNSNKNTAIASWCAGDFNADGLVDALDFGYWNRSAFGPRTPMLNAAVPEPGTGLFASCSALLLAGRRRLRRTHTRRKSPRT